MTIGNPERKSTNKAHRLRTAPTFPVAVMSLPSKASVSVRCPRTIVSNTERVVVTVASALLLAGLAWLAAGSPAWPGWVLSAGASLWLIAIFRQRM